jgi:hypothetical protein
MGTTFGIAIFSGSLCAFIASRFPFPLHIFDDYEHFKNVEYGDNLDQYNAADIVDNTNNSPDSMVQSD